MKSSLTFGGILPIAVPCALLGGTAIFLGQFLVQPMATAIPGTGDGGTASVGPDVIVGAVNGISAYTPALYNSVSYAAYAFGTTSCNIGTAQLQWQPNPSNLHPTIPQNLYRIKGGRFEQIGLSWCKHGFCALQETLCGACTPAGGGCPTVLGIGCSDPYSSGLNGGQSDLKSRGPINAATGVFSGTYTDPTAPSTLATSLRERCMVARDDLNPALNAGALYFAECQYVHQADAASGNDNNNASYRQVTVGATWSGSTGYPLTLSGPTLQQSAGIYAWKANTAGVSVTPYDVVGDGRFHVGFIVTDNGNGTWHYEYAVHNLCSDRNGGSFSVPVPAGVTLSNIGFKSPSYFNGEGYTNAAWATSTAGNAITWSCEPNTNVLANALRWSTTMNFRFDANIAPNALFVQGSLGLWKAPTAGSPDSSIAITIKGPGTPVVSIPGDFDNDGDVDASDLATLLGSWGTTAGDINGDGDTNASDLAVLLGNWS